jgi:hypothetical protein
LTRLIRSLALMTVIKNLGRHSSGGAAPGWWEGQWWRSAGRGKGSCRYRAVELAEGEKRGALLPPFEAPARPPRRPPPPSPISRRVGDPPLAAAGQQRAPEMRVPLPPWLSREREQTKEEAEECRRARGRRKQAAQAMSRRHRRSCAGEGRGRAGLCAHGSPPARLLHGHGRARGRATPYPRVAAMGETSDMEARLLHGRARGRAAPYPRAHRLTTGRARHVRA